jgi:hypothetical protein
MPCLYDNSLMPDIQLRPESSESSYYRLHRANHDTRQPRMLKMSADTYLMNLKWAV